MSDRFPLLRMLALALALVFLASGCSAKPEFDSARAYSLLKKQCDFGPRVPGTPEHRRTRDYFIEELSLYSSRAVKTQDFTVLLDGRKVTLSNVIAEFGPSGADGILLCAHWDTRPTADEELDPKDRQKPILGANDGASGVAVLLQLAAMFKQQPPAVPVTIVLFDGEDWGMDTDHMFYGSRYFAKNLPGNYRFGILLDMVGDKNFTAYRERNSDEGAKWVVDKVWNAAAEIGYKKHFINRAKYTIGDDHIPLLEAGVPCIDVIDLDYAYWHTLKDTPDKCSPQTLKIVGDTIAKVVYDERPLGK